MVSIPAAAPVSTEKVIFVQSVDVQPEFDIKVGNPTRIADGLGSYVTYTVNTSTTNEKYSYSQCVVIRRYSDFLWLHDVLASDYPYCIIPPMPEKSVVNNFDIDFVEIRRAALQSFIREVSQDPVLKESKHLRTFLTADDDKLSEEKKETKTSLKDELKENPMEAAMKMLKFVGTGIKGVSNQVQKSVAQQMGNEAPMSEEDKKLAKYVEYLNDLNTQVVSLASKAQEFVDNQREMSMNMSDMGLALSLMGQLQQDVVGDAMRTMNDGINILTQLYNEKSAREERAFVEPMRRLGLILNEVKVTIGRRTVILNNYQDAYQSMKKAKANYKKLAATPGKSSKVAGAEEEIDRCKKRAGKLKKKLSIITEKITGILDDFRVHKMKLIRAMVVDLLQIQMQYYKQVGNVWRNYYPELQKINMEEALKAANEMAVASVDENRPRNRADDSEEEEEESGSENSGDDSDEDSDSDEKPKKKSKKESSSEEESESQSDDDDDDSDDDSDSDSDEKPKKKSKKPAKKPAKKGKKHDSSDESSSD